MRNGYRNRQRKRCRRDITNLHVCYQTYTIRTPGYQLTDSQLRIQQTAGHRLSRIVTWIYFVGPYPDCRRCNYTKGQVWFPDPKNCHLYYICDKIDRMDGSWYFRVYHPTCGKLFWDQDRLTCVRSVPKNANCDIGDVVTWDPPTTTYGKTFQLREIIKNNLLFKFVYSLHWQPKRLNSATRTQSYIVDHKFINAYQ